MAQPAPRQMLTVTADPSSVDHVLAMIERFGDSARLANKDCLRLQLIFEEILANTLEHGQAPPDSPITVAIACLGEVIEADYSDQGSAFDPTAAPEVDLDAEIEDRPVGKLGWVLIRRLCNAIEYHRDGMTNRIRFQVPVD